ncbi:MAG: DUF1552 domain-containing protein [Gemmataceae bacterium]
MFHGPISRRTILKGLGTAIALPYLEAMLPTTAVAATPAGPPKRLAFLYVPNGAHMQEWTPEKLGKGYDLPKILEPLAPFQDRLNVLSGLTLDKARANGDGPGDHARSLASFLTGRQARKTAGSDIKIGVSADQVAAQHVGSQTRFQSLELGCEPGRQAGSCDSGYSCAYSSNISWRGDATPNAKEIDPKQVFERLFAGGKAGESAEATARRERYRKSILDSVLEDANSLKGQLGAADVRKLDEYLESVRELENRIEKFKQPVDPKLASGMTKPGGVPKDYAEHLKLMADLMVLAFRGDLTRVGTFVFANEGSNRSYSFLGVPEGHHDLSHHGGDKKKQEKIRQINTFHTTQLAYLLGKMKGVKEGNGTLLDNVMLVYGSGIGDGNRHNHDDLPVLLIGGGGGKLKTAQHLKYPRETPLTNLYLSLLDIFGARVETLGDSTGRLTGIA